MRGLLHLLRRDLCDVGHPTLLRTLLAYDSQVAVGHAQRVLGDELEQPAALPAIGGFERAVVLTLAIL